MARLRGGSLMTNYFKRFGALISFACVLTGCNGQYLMEDIEVKLDGEWRLIGGGCMAIESGRARGGSLAGNGSEEAGDSFDIEMESHGGKATVKISTASESIDLEFDGKFMHSGEREIYEITTEAGREYRMTYWGESDCNVRPESDFYDLNNLNGMGGASR